MATGVGFSFDTSFLQNLEKADKKMEALMDKSNSLSASVVSAFSKMSKNGVLPYIESLESKIRTLNSIKFSIGENASSDMKKLKEETSNAIDVINKLLTTLKQRPEYYNEVGRGQAQKVIDEYNRELEATRNYTRQRIQMYSDMFDKIDRRENEKRQQNQQVRDNAVQARANYEATIRMYEQMYAQIDAKEKEKERRYLETQKREEEAAARKAKSVIDQANRELEAYRNAYKQRQQMYEQMWREIERRESSNRRGDYQNAMLGGAGGIKSADSALRYADRIYSDRGLRSVNNMQKAIQQMQQAQQRLNLNTEQGRQKYEQLDKEIKRVKGDIDRVTGASENLNKSHKGLLDTSGQLARAMAAVFSVSAIKGYVNKLMQIRGEFELQQRSLQVLLQNKDEANALWDKTVALAVKSPYTTKQLVTATKQLAAYRVESEKLYETNKMLADVSIGLGVDMNRLILAFGQVKAANFLRGTELRQFSEAGVNMLDELAKRFTALEGRAVSVGEVFERVSKRMVSFADVEAVFKTITSEGGTFYQMQEKQSETLKGMMLNLRDSYELMLNDIGKGNEGMLKSFVSFMRVLVDGWREAAVVIKTAGTAMLFYFAASKIARIGSAFSGLWAAMAANPIAAIAAGAGALIGLAVSLYQHTNKLNEAINEVEKNVTESLEESIALYHKLTDTINDSTASLDERNKAYEELKTKFKDILPDQLTELKYIESLAFNYKAAEDAMFSYYNAKAIEQKKDKIEGIYEGDFDRDTKDIIRQIKENIDDIDKLNEEQKTRMKAGVSSAVYKAIEELRKGNISDKTLTSSGLSAIADNLVEEIEKNLKTFSGDYVKLLDSNVFKNAKELAKTAEEYRDAMSDVSGLAYQTFDQKQAQEAQEAFKEEMDTATRYFKDLVKLRQKIADNKIDLTTPDAKLNKEQLSKRTWYLNSIQNIYNALVKDVPQYANKIKELDKTLLDSANKGAYEYKLALGDIENELFNVFAENAKSLSSGDEGAQAMLDNFAENIKATADSKLATPLMEAITSAFNKAINDKDLSQKGKDLLAKLLPDEKQSTGDVRKMVEALLTQYRDEVKKWENATTAGATSLPLVEYLNQFGDKKFKSAMGMYLGSDAEFNELQQKVIPVLEHIDRLLGGDPDKDKKGRNRDLVDERLRVIKEIYKAYKELNKTFDETISKTGALEKFGDAFYSAFGKTPEQMGYNLFTAEGVVDAYNKFISTLSKADDITKGNLAKGEFVMELQVERKQAADKQIADEIASMFDGYELSLELDKLNIPKDLASRLFGIEDIDLSDIRKRIEQEIYNAQLKGGQEDFIAKRKEELEKVKDMEIKQQRELLKTYSKYLVQAQSERIKIKLDELRQIKEIESLEIGDADKELMRQGVQKDIQKRLDTQAWKDFQESGMYVRLFENLEGASMHSLDKMENALMALRDSLKDLDPSELKEINNQLEKIRDIKVDKNPFKGLADDAKTYFEYVNNRKEWEASLDASEEKEANIRNEADSQSLLIKSLEDELDLIDQTTDEGIAYALVLESKVELEKEYLKVLLDELEAQGKITREERERIENGQDAGKSIQDRLNKTAQEISAVTSSMADMATNLEAAFGMSDSLKDTFELLQGIGGGVSDMFSGAAGLFSGNPLQMIQGGMQLVSGVSKIFASFNEAHDKRIERKIESEIKLVERLGKLYEKLEKQIEAAYSIDTFQAANDAAKENLEQQIRATERMIEAEKDKKKTDQKRIDEWREQIEENLELLEELEAKRLQELGGIGGEDAYKDIAQGFTDAWFDAFLETEDGLDALNDHFDEVLNNIVKKQLTLRATNSFLAPIFEEIDKAVKDTKVTNEEMQKIKDLASQTMPELAAFLENIATEMGMSEYAGKNGELSGLSAGIQGISESQADTIAAYLNSLRFYVADSNTQLKALVAAQGLDTDAPNPMLSQLLVIAEQTRSIRDMFESVIGRGGNNKHGGAYLKVDIG